MTSVTLYYHQQSTKSILNEVHNRAISGHMGIQKTLDKFCSKFYWPSAHCIVSDYEHKCEDC